MAEMKKIIPRDDDGSRHSMKMSREVIEQDFSAQQSANSELKAAIASLSSRLSALSNTVPPFGEMVFLAFGGNTLAESGEGREFYTGIYTQFRLVIGEEGTAGADYDLQYYDGGWVDAGTTVTTGAADPVAYHGAWEDIPAGMLAFDMPLLRVLVANDVAGTDTAFIGAQFWDGSRGTPPESGGPLP